VSTRVTVSSAGKPMVWRNNSGAWVEVMVNGELTRVRLDVAESFARPASVIGALQSAGYSVKER